MAEEALGSVDGQVSLVSSLTALLPGQPVAIFFDALLVREMALAVPAKISG